MTCNKIWLIVLIIIVIYLLYNNCDFSSMFCNTGTVAYCD